MENLIVTEDIITTKIIITDEEKDNIVSEFLKLFKPQFQLMIEILSKTRRSPEQTKKEFKQSLMLLHKTYPSALI